MFATLYLCAIFFLGGMAIWHRRYAWLIDLALLALTVVCSQPARWLVVVVIAGIVRRWPRWFVFDLAARRPFVWMPDHLLAVALPGSGPVRNQAGTDRNRDGSAHQNQIEPSELETIELPDRPTRQNDWRTDQVDYLARQVGPDGDYLYSANAILKLVGGTAADIKAQIAAIRGPTMPRTQGHVERPPQGWK